MQLNHLLDIDSKYYRELFQMLLYKLDIVQLNQLLMLVYMLIDLYPRQLRPALRAGQGVYGVPEASMIP